MFKFMFVLALLTGGCSFVIDGLHTPEDGGVDAVDAGKVDLASPDATSSPDLVGDSNIVADGAPDLAPADPPSAADQSPDLVVVTGPDLATADFKPASDLMSPPDLMSVDTVPASTDAAPDLVVVGGQDLTMSSPDMVKPADLMSSADLTPPADQTSPPDLVLGCATNADCAAKTTGACKMGVCQPPTCTDGIKNQDETDIDCGGATCAKCADGKTCSVPADCAGGGCEQSGNGVYTCTPTNTVYVFVTNAGNATILRCSNGSSLKDLPVPPLNQFTRVDGQVHCWFIASGFTPASGVTGKVSRADGTTLPFCPDYEGHAGEVGFWVDPATPCQ